MHRAIVVNFLFVTIFCINTLNGQDVIINLGLNNKPLKSKDITIQNNYVSFIDSRDAKKYEFSLDDVSNIIFYENLPSEIYIPRLQFDTIRCNIDSISINRIYFRDSNNKRQEFDKDNVFCISFSEGENETINSYASRFLQLNSVQYSIKPRIIKRDGSKVNIYKLSYLTNSRIGYNQHINGNEKFTSIPVSDISSYINKEPINKRKIDPSSDFILLKKGEIVETIISKINAKSIECIVNSGLKTKTLSIDKDSIAGVLFFDYTAPNIFSSSNIENISSTNQGSFKRVTLDFNAGFGYVLAKASDKLSKEEKQYVDEMRLGFSFDMNLNFFPSKNFGIGAKYNQYHTSNSSYEYADNLKVRFLGFNLLGQFDFVNSRGKIYSGLSMGYISEVNNATVMQEDRKIEGSTFGTYLFTGADIFLNHNFSIGIKAGLMTGKLDKVKVDGETRKLEEEENLLRFDGMVNLKFSF